MPRNALLLTALAIFSVALTITAARADEPPVDAPATQPAPFSPEQLAWLKTNVLDKQPPYKLHFDIFMKGLYKNDQSNGSVWLGNPHPEGDNYSGSNGMAGEISISIDGKVIDGIAAGARLETRFGALFADFYENGDLAVDGNGRPSGVNATGESLGMNHAAYVQLRGIYIDWDKPAMLPTVTKLRAGSSDLSQWNAFTVGKIRFIDRDNAKGLFLFGAVPEWDLDYNAARIALPKLYASAGFNTGISDPLVENPFWARDAVYAVHLHVGNDKKASFTINASYLIDEEADLNDPDALGSTNLIDPKDGVVSTIPRYQNWNGTFEGLWNPTDNIHTGLLVGGSRSDPNLGLVYNTVDNDQGLSPIPLKTVNGYAIRARFEGIDLTPGFTLRAEYFNIGADWVATMGARREDDVLWTEGFLDGQVPTLNIANEFMDFTEPFYETIVGWHGATLKPKFDFGVVDLELEATVIGYNTNGQGRCTSKNVPGCQATGGQYPDFLFPDGMTDTDFFTFANTNDRGRDPRAAYRTNQDRLTYLGFARGGVNFGEANRGRVEASIKYIRDRDLRDTTIAGDDDYLGNLITVNGKASWRLSPRASLSAGIRYDSWDEAHRSGAVIAGVPRYPDYDTTKAKIWAEGRYEVKEGALFTYRAELLEKDVTTSEPSLNYSYKNVIRSILTFYAGF